MYAYTIFLVGIKTHNYTFYTKILNAEIHILLISLIDILKKKYVLSIFFYIFRQWLFMNMEEFLLWLNLRILKNSVKYLGILETLETLGNIGIYFANLIDARQNRDIKEHICQCWLVNARQKWTVLDNNRLMWVGHPRTYINDITTILVFSGKKLAKIGQLLSISKCLQKIATRWYVPSLNNIWLCSSQYKTIFGAILVNIGL